MNTKQGRFIQCDFFFFKKSGKQRELFFTVKLPNFIVIILRVYHAWIQKVLSTGAQLCNSDVFLCFFLVDEGREDPKTTKCEQSSARQRRIANKPYMFVIFQGRGGGSDRLSPLWIRACVYSIGICHLYFSPITHFIF